MLAQRLTSLQRNITYFTDFHPRTEGPPSKRIVAAVVLGHKHTFIITIAILQNLQN